MRLFILVFIAHNAAKNLKDSDVQQVAKS